MFETLSDSLRPFLIDDTFPTLLDCLGPFEQASLVAQTVRICLQCGRPVQFLHQENPLENGRAVHSSILAWKTPWTEEPGGLQSMESQRVGHN